MKALSVKGYTSPTPIQQQAIPVVLQQRDLLACAQTGTGKTAAFAIPVLQLMHQQAAAKTPPPGIGALVLAPTRELAIQIGDSFRIYGQHLHLRSLVIFGGVNQTSQVQALRRGVDILIATPGRLLDLLNQGHLSLGKIRFLVLDEADRMLDMGFIHDVKKIIARLPVARQTLFFSATMPPAIQQLSAAMLRQPVRVEVTPVSSTADTVQQSLYHVAKKDKVALLVHLLEDASISSSLVFTRTKHGANRLSKDLLKAGITAEAIHGNKSQQARQKALQNFRDGRTRILVATDIAARGIDISELPYVFNYELPDVPETYVHRIGRTGRAGATGKAISFCDPQEVQNMKDIQKLLGRPIPLVKDHPYAGGAVVPVKTAGAVAVPSSKPLSTANYRGRAAIKSGSRRAFYRQYS